MRFERVYIIPSFFNYKQVILNERNIYMSDNMKDKRNPRFMGKVKKWNSERGFGFIKCFEDGKEYYINSRFIGDEKELIRGSVVEFEIWNARNDKEKKFAAKVIVIELPERY